VGTHCDAEFLYACKIMSESHGLAAAEQV